jgi:hypothetical protein
LGDRFYNNHAGQYTEHIITEFKIHGDYLRVYIGDGLSHYPLYALQTINKPILTTHDGKDIYVFDKCWYVGKEFEINEWVVFETEILHLDKLKYFSTKEAAEEYILFNKPMLSVKDVENLFRVQDRKSIVMNCGCDVIKKEDLIELAKSKTKTND